MNRSPLFTCYLIAGLVFSGLVSAAWAQGSRKVGVFHRFDKNGDGIVTAAELPDTQTLAKYDQNGDGKVTLEEFRATVAGQLNPSNPENEAALSRIDEYIKKTDKNGDGSLSRDEVGGEEWFDRLDRNQDGLIGSGEIAAFRVLVKKFGEKRALEVSAHQVTKEEVAKITSGPEILKPGDVGIGRMISDVEFTDITNKTHRLSDVRNHKGFVIAMTSATCPVSKRLLPSLAKLESSLLKNDFPMILVNAFASESVEVIREQLASHQFAAAYIHDRDKKLSRALAATTTTEVFLIDNKQTLLYRGALDDQYGVDYSLNEPRQHFLEDAVAAHLAAEVPVIAATVAPGCELNLGGGEAGAGDITYYRDVARILQRNCAQCHHDGGIAPFALDDFEEVSDRVKVIERVVSEGTMPPWFAAKTEEGGPSPWANDHSLSSRDKTDLLAWLNSDHPGGDLADAPKPLSYPKEWTIGEPDLIIPLSKAYKIQATGFMPYQNDVVTVELTEDKWISGYEILPSERDVVHHVIVKVLKKGETHVDRGEAEGFWAAYVPGNGAVQYPEGFARKLPAGARVHFQIHYTPSGVEKMERLRLGLHFADKTPKYEVKTLAIADHRLNIPPGSPNHAEGASRTVPFDIPAISFMAHMHVRGSAFSFEITHPYGKSEMLLDIPRYDFNWQLRYELKTPKFLPADSTIKVTGTFDNSTKNKANPDPTKTIRWGDQTYDEMLIGYIEYFVPAIDPSIAEIDSAE